jgi:hypothetical protein
LIDLKIKHDDEKEEINDTCASGVISQNTAISDVLFAIFFFPFSRFFFITIDFFNFYCSN